MTRPPSSGRGSADLPATSSPADDVEAPASRPGVAESQDTAPGDAVSGDAAPGDGSSRDAASRAEYALLVEALPDVCAGDPSRMVFTADAGGRCEVFAWDARSGRARQVSDRPLGTLHGTIDPAGNVWWLDEDADGTGVWRTQPFAGGPDRPGLTGVAPGTPRGLAVTGDGTVVMGVGYGDATHILIGARGGPARVLARRDRFASVAGVTGTGPDVLVAVSGPARSAHAVTVLGADGSVHAVLSGIQGALWALGFPPDPPDPPDLRTPPDPQNPRTPQHTPDEPAQPADADPAAVSAAPGTSGPSSAPAPSVAPAAPNPSATPGEPGPPGTPSPSVPHAAATPSAQPAGQGSSTPHPAPGELLLVRETDRGYELAGWRPRTGLRAYPWCSFDTEITACWYPEGRRVLIRQDRHGRSRLLRADLDAGVLAPVATPPGTLLDAAPRPGGDLHYMWTDTAHPPRTHSTAGTALPMPGPTAAGAEPDTVPGTHRDLWTPGPGGPVHTWLSLPDRPHAPEPTYGPHAPHSLSAPHTAGGPGGPHGHPAQPPPVVFLVHGGPADHDRDAYDGLVHSLVGAGLAVARVNYRGSTGYGPRWRAAFDEGVGLTQVADLAAVRADLVSRGLVRADAVALWGTSWGGYLTLLALGVHPGLWQAGVAVKPVADSVAAYRTTTGTLRALDERLYGGTPDEVPEAYRRGSPISYADRVRAPLLVVAATRDVKCPPGQVRGYLDTLRAAGVPHEAMWLDTGHDGYEGAHHAALMRRAVLFLHRNLHGPRPAPTTPPADGREAAERFPARDAAPSAPAPTEATEPTETV